MTQEPNVTQADREAAADLYLALEGPPYSPADLARANEHRSGEYDAHASVQAFARPLYAHAAPAKGHAELVEALVDVRAQNAADMKRSGAVWEAYDRAVLDCIAATATAHDGSRDDTAKGGA